MDLTPDEVARFNVVRDVMVANIMSGYHELGHTCECCADKRIRAHAIVSTMLAAISLALDKQLAITNIKPSDIISGG